MAANELCKVLAGEDPEQDYLKVSCANVNSVFELFGGSGAYQGSGTGSELNNFVMEHRERIGVVNLDEFDRLDAKVLSGLFTIFDKGEWVDKRSCSAYQTKAINCSKIVWILTTNVFDDQIDAFYTKEKDAFKKRDWKSIERKMKKGFKSIVSLQFGDAMARRLGPVIPFVPFNKADRVALIEAEIDCWRVSYASPAPLQRSNPDAPVRLVGNFSFTVDPLVVEHIAAAYDKHQGATSLRDCLEEEIVNPINAAYFEGEIGCLEHSKGHFFLANGEPGDDDSEIDLRLK